MAWDWSTPLPPPPPRPPAIIDPPTPYRPGPWRALAFMAFADAVIILSIGFALLVRPNFAHRDAPACVPRPFRVTCPACKWDLTVHYPVPPSIDLGTAAKTGTGEAPR